MKKSRERAELPLFTCCRQNVHGLRLRSESRDGSDLSKTPDSDMLDDDDDLDVHAMEFAPTAAGHKDKHRSRAGEGGFSLELQALSEG